MPFPIILYPEPVKEFLKETGVKPPNILQPPQPTNHPKPAPSNSHNQQMIWQTVWSTFATVVVANFFAGVIVVLFFDNISIWVLFLLLLSINGAVVMTAVFYSRRGFASSLRQQELLLKQYEEQQLLYKRAWDEWVMKQRQHKDADLKVREKIATKLAKYILLPAGYSDAPQGVSEGYFKKYLYKYFCNKIHQGLQLPIPGSEYSYSADFTYVDEDMSLYIDCEIDEPYYGMTGEPTHCCDETKDKNRNIFFLKNNWIVIRFAEEQVVKYPESCCEVIAKVVASISGEWELLDQFKGVRYLPTVKHWTAKEAKRMARSKYRDKYLNKIKNHR